MKVHTSAYKDNIQIIGKQITSKITYLDNGQEITIAEEDINSVTPAFEGSILKSVMKELTIDCKFNIPRMTEINYQFGLMVNNSYEYLDFGKYYVVSTQEQKDTGSYKILCYDKMIYTMVANKDLQIEYPVTIRNYIKTICDKIGIEFANEQNEFANYDKLINSELYFGQDYTFRDIFDELAQATASTICINKDNKLEIRYISENSVDTINEEMLKDVNVDFGQKYGPINTIVLSRADADNIYIEDKASVEANGRTELKIVDNQIMNWDNREEFLPDILEKLDGLEYYMNDFSSPGITYLEVCDKYNVEINSKQYQCIMFNDEISIAQGGLSENVYTEEPEETKTDYKKSDKTDRKVNQVLLSVDKQNAQIDALVKTSDSTSQQLAQITLTTNSIQNTVQDTKSSVSEVSESVKHLASEMTTLQTSTNLQIKNLDTKVENGVENVKNTTVDINSGGATFGVEGSPFNLNINYQNLNIHQGSEEIAFFGYDQNLNKTVARIPDLETTKMTAGVHRVEKIERDGEERTGWYYIGGD